MTTEVSPSMSDHVPTASTAASPLATAAISARGLVRRYGDITALDGVGVDVIPGQVLGILGPNGAGKTTLIETLLGLRKADAGTVLIEGRSFDPKDPELRRLAAIQPQTGAVFETLTVVETVDLFRSLYPAPEDTDVLLDAVDLLDRRTAKVKTLSGGQLQRLRLALALAGRTRIVVLDEPTSALDPAAREQVWDTIRARARFATIVLTTHSMEEAEAICDRVLLMDQGRIIADGAPAALVAGHGGKVTMVVRGLAPDADPTDLPGVRHGRGRPHAGRSVWYLTTDDPHRVTSALVGRYGRDVDIHQRPTGLGEVFLTLTGRGLAEGK